jgi:hypothetical protein
MFPVAPREAAGLLGIELGLLTLHESAVRQLFALPSFHLNIIPIEYIFQKRNTEDSKKKEQTVVSRDLDKL